MKILREYGEEKIVDCPECETQLAVTYGDVETHRVNCDYLGDCDTKRGIKCPKCLCVFNVAFGKNKPG